jgi:hypothetical protein
VEGKHALAARQPVEVVSTALIDLAVSNETPIVPVRFAGGLPVTPVTAPLAFPVDYGQQDFLIGAPLLPEDVGAAVVGGASAARSGRSEWLRRALAARDAESWRCCLCCGCRHMAHRTGRQRSAGRALSHTGCGAHPKRRDAVAVEQRARQAPQRLCTHR